MKMEEKQSSANDFTDINDILNSIKRVIIEKNVENFNKMIDIKKDLLNLNVNIETKTKEHEAFELEEKVLSSELQKIDEEKQLLEEELKKKKQEAIKLELAKNELKTELKTTHEAIKMAAHYYKSAFNIHLELENTNENIFTLRFFTQSKNTDQYYVKIQMNREEKSWKLLDMVPRPDNYEEIAEHLKSTGDIQGFLGFARKIFIKMGGHD